MHRREVHRQDPAIDDLLPAEQRERRREDRRAHEKPAHHGARLGREERGFLDDGAELPDRGPDGGARLSLSRFRTPMRDESVAGGEDASAERADGCRLRRCRQAEHDGTEHHDDQDRQRKERAQQHLEHFEPRPVPGPVEHDDQGDAEPRVIQTQSASRAARLSSLAGAATAAAGLPLRRRRAHAPSFAGRTEALGLLRPGLRPSFARPSDDWRRQCSAHPPLPGRRVDRGLCEVAKATHAEMAATNRP